MMTGGDITILILFILLLIGGTTRLILIIGVFILIHGDGHPGTMVTTHPGIDPIIMVIIPITILTGTITDRTGAVHPKDGPLSKEMGTAVILDRLLQVPAQELLSERVHAEAVLPSINHLHHPGTAVPQQGLVTEMRQIPAIQEGTVLERGQGALHRPVEDHHVQGDQPHDPPADPV